VEASRVRLHDDEQWLGDRLARLRGAEDKLRAAAAAL
jgi:hypothetical protein